LAFVRHLLRTRRITRRFREFALQYRRQWFWLQMCSINFSAKQLQDFALHCDDECELQQRFLSAALPPRSRQT